MSAARPAFGPELFAFLRRLARHDDRGWFQARRAEYEAAVRDPPLRFCRGTAPFDGFLARALDLDW